MTRGTGAGSGANEMLVTGRGLGVLLAMTALIGFFANRAANSQQQQTWLFAGTLALMVGSALLSRLVVRPREQTARGARWFAVGTALEGEAALHPTGRTGFFPAVGTLRLEDDGALVWEPRPTPEADHGFRPLRWAPDEVPPPDECLTWNRDLLGWRHQQLRLTRPGGDVVRFGVTKQSAPLPEVLARGPRLQ